MYRDKEQRGCYLPEELNPEGFTNLNQLFDHCIGRFKNRIAYTSLGCSLSYHMLDQYSRAFASYLLNDAGLKPGDRIAVQLPNLIQYPIVVFGALRAGVVVVNTNPLYTPEEMCAQFRDSGARLLVIYASMAHKAEEILDKTDISRVLVTQVGDFGGTVRGRLLNFAVRYIKRLEAPYNLPGAEPLKSALERHLDGEAEYPELKLSDIAVLQYTGGTTGVSKGAVLTHANLMANILQGSRLMRSVPDGWADLVVSPLPLYHIYAFIVSQIVAVEGGQSLLIPNPRDLNGFIKTLERVRMTCFVGLNTLFIGLCRHPRFRKVDMSALKATVSGGMALTSNAARMWRDQTGQEIVELYGLTEASPGVSANDPLNPRVGTIGKPLAFTEVDIRESGYRSLGVGEPGELCVKGPQVMKEYWHRPDETAAVFTADGYLKTGDIAEIDEEGYIRIVDRAKDVIIVSGFNVYPNEVEDVVSRHQDIIECAAIGATDAACGEIVHLYAVSANPQLSEQALIAWCKERLASYKCPRKVIFQESLPKTPVGKVLRRALRD